MLTKSEALELVSKGLQQMSRSADPFVVVEEKTIETPFGWVFFYNSKRFVETGEYQYQLAGNGPVIVNMT
jgi:Immunity protein 35